MKYSVTIVNGTARYEVVAANPHHAACIALWEKSKPGWHGVHVLNLETLTQSSFRLYRPLEQPASIIGYQPSAVGQNEPPLADSR